VNRSRVVLTEDWTATAIAQKLGRNQSVISREILRNGGRDEYSVVRAQARADRLCARGTHFVRGIHEGALPYYVAGVINGDIPNIETRFLRNGRVGYWDHDKEVVVIEDGDGGTVFTPTRGYNCFQNELN
jgi:hypothetical protein